MTKAVLEACGGDEMVFKSNENFGGDTITWTLNHITEEGRMLERERGADSDDPDARRISVSGFGYRFFTYREAGALRQLIEKLKDSNQSVRHRAMEEIMACFDFNRGRDPDKRQAFLLNPSNRAILNNLEQAVFGYLGGHALAPGKEKSILELLTLLAPQTQQGESNGEQGYL